MAQPLLLGPHLQVVLRRFNRVMVALPAIMTDLTPLYRPSEAYLSPAMRQIVTALVHHPRYPVAMANPFPRSRPYR